MSVAIFSQEEYKMKRFVIWASVMFILGASLAFAGGGQSSSGRAASGKIVLEMLDQNTVETIETSMESRGFNHMKDLFAKEHPEIQINITELAQMDMHVKLMALAATNDLPDLFDVKGSWVPNWSTNNLLADLSPYIDAKVYRAGLCDPLSKNGKLLAVPYQFTLTSVVYWNAAMFRDIGYDHFPRTWDELVDADKKFKSKGIVTLAAGNIDRWWYESCVLSALGDRFTGTEWTDNIIANNGKAKFTDKVFIDALRYSQQMAPMFNRDFNAINNDQGQALYAQGKTAACFNGGWMVSYLLPNAEPDVLANTRFAVCPTFPGTKGDANASSGGGWAMGASSKLSGDKLQAAASFLKYVTGPELSQFMMDHSGYIGPNPAQIRDRSKMHPLSSAFIDFLDGVKVIPVYDLQMDGSVIDIMNSGLQELLNGTITPEKLAADIQATQDRVR
jgi:raffinose/stachyose/melibiose transport system substrate-binding protein